MQKQIQVHAGDPLDQTALLETQRNLYNLALFNEVVTAVQNPAGRCSAEECAAAADGGEAVECDVWLRVRGADGNADSRHDLGGVADPAGTDSVQTVSQEGKTGVSPRVSLDVSRINLRGTENSLTLHSTYGLLEQMAMLTFQNPHLFGAKNFSASISGGYSNVQNITTFASSTLQGDFRVTQKCEADGHVYLRLSVPASEGGSEQSAGVGGPDSAAVAAGARGRPGYYVVSRYAAAEPTGCGEGIVSRRCRSFWRRRSSDLRRTSGGWMGRTRRTTSLASSKYVLARNTRIGYEQVVGSRIRMQGNARVPGRSADDQSKLQCGAAAGAAVCRWRDVASWFRNQWCGAARSCRRAFRWAGRLRL